MRSLGRSQFAGFLVPLIPLLGWVAAGLASPVAEGLYPGLAALPDFPVPPLHEERTEALVGEGLEIANETPFAWSKTSPSDEPFRLRVSVEAGSFDHAFFTVWNWHNDPVRQWRVEAGETREFELTVEGRGCYLLTLDGYREGRCDRRFIRSIAVSDDLSRLRDVWKTSDYFLGICAFPGRYHWKPEGRDNLPEGLTEEQARQLEASLLARAGFQVVRPDVSLEMNRSEDGEGYLYRFDRMDAAVRAYTSLGFELALQLMNAGDWATAEKYADVAEPENSWRYPREEGSQRAYIEALVERYGEHARFVQIFNEPDQLEFWSGTPSEFVEQFRYSHEQIRRWRKDVPIVNGGYAFVDEDKVRYFVHELRGLLDFQAYHAHGPLQGLKVNFSGMRRFHEQADYESTAWLNTETGFDAWRLDQERRQAQAIAQKTLYCWANDHRGILLFCGRMTKGPGRDGRDLGLLDYQFGPKFAYGAIAALASVLAGASFEAPLSDDGEDADRHLYLFRRGDDLILSGFTLASRERAAFASDAREVHYVDEMGNRHAVAEREAKLELDGYPRYLVFSGASFVRLADVRPFRED